MNLQLVTWRDAWFTPTEDVERPDYLMQTVGWTRVRKRRGRLWLVVKSEKQPHGDGHRGITHIPIENVVSRRDLKVKKAPR